MKSVFKSSELNQQEFTHRIRVDFYNNKIVSQTDCGQLKLKNHFDYFVLPPKHSVRVKDVKRILAYSNKSNTDEFNLTFCSANTSYLKYFSIVEYERNLMGLFPIELETRLSKDKKNSFDIGPDQSFRLTRKMETYSQSKHSEILELSGLYRFPYDEETKNKMIELEKATMRSSRSFELRNLGD